MQDPERKKETKTTMVERQEIEGRRQRKRNSKQRAMRLENEWARRRKAEGHAERCASELWDQEMVEQNENCCQCLEKQKQRKEKE